MSARPNYFKLGLFILIALFLLAAGIVLFGSGVLDKKKVYFETYFTDSVSGLNPGAPVQDNGVEIGTVERISFIRNDYELPDSEEGFAKYRPYVRVVCSVRAENLPIMTDQQRREGLKVLIENGLRLQLSTNILTGQGFIEAKYVKDPERFPVEEYPWKSQYPYIPSAPSTFTTLKDSVDKILHRLEQIETEEIAKNLNALIKSVDQAIDDLDFPGLTARAATLMDHADQAIEDAQIAKLSAEAQALFSEVRQTNQDLKKLLSDAPPDEELASIAELVDQLNTTLVKIDRLIRVHSPQLVETLNNFKQITDNLRDLTENLENNPSMIFSEPPKKKEASK